LPNKIQTEAYWQRMYGPAGDPAIVSVHKSLAFRSGKVIEPPPAGLSSIKALPDKSL
jgi:hypothetical protein